MQFFVYAMVKEVNENSQAEGISMNNIFDLFMFMGQSNMAGRGILSGQWPQKAPELVPGAGYEYRAVSDPQKLHVVAEPFGAAENDPEGIFEPGMKTGSMVTAFINAYYAETGIPVIGISASKGGSPIQKWQGNRDYLSDALRRLTRAEGFLKGQDLKIRHRFMVWCQGETDGDLGTTAEEYKARFENMFGRVRESGIEKCFLITTGEYNGDDGFDYSGIRQAQLELCRELADVELVCDEFHRMRVRGLMKDAFHYYQRAYNEVGTAAGSAAGRLVRRMP